MRGFISVNAVLNSVVHSFSATDERNFRRVPTMHTSLSQTPHNMVAPKNLMGPRSCQLGASDRTELAYLNP